MDGNTDLQSWDTPYYSEKLQETKFKFNQEELRPYFSADKALNGIIRCRK